MFAKGNRVQLNAEGIGSVSPRSRAKWARRVGTFLRIDRDGTAKVRWDGTFAESYVSVRDIQFVEGSEGNVCPTCGRPFVGNS